MRRREPGAEGLEPPERLVRFDRTDWPDPGPPPQWWDTEGYPWHLFEAQLRWVRARRHWVVQHGNTPEAVSAIYGEQRSTARCGR